MKRLLFVTATTILTVAAIGGCRGGTSWFHRGAECQPNAQPCTENCPPDCDPMYGSSVPMGMPTTTLPATMEALPAN